MFADEFDFRPSVRRNRTPDGKRRVDWHPARSGSEPLCAADQWRTRDRSEVLYISEMTDRHLMYALKYASALKQHASKLQALVEEVRRRGL